MNKKAQGDVNAKIVILLAITIILGFSFINIIANSQANISEKHTIINESDSLSSCYATSSIRAEVNESASACNITLTNAPTDWRASDSQCALGSVTVTNSSGSALVSGTDYNIYTSSGILQFLNTTSTNATFMPSNNSLTGYTFCDAGYLQNASDRALIKILVTLLVIVLLVTAVGVTNKMLNK